MSSIAKSYFCSMRSSVLLYAFAATTSFGQWDIPVRMVLDAPDGEQRQIVGVASPTSEDAAVSLEAARNLSTSFAQVVGTDVLSGSLSPLLTGYTTGMVVTIMPQQTNNAGASLALNGLAPVLLKRQDGAPLDSADLPPGIPARLAYNGTDFILLGSVRIKCPLGYTAGGNDFCIADSASASTTFWLANQRCGNQGARLCTVAEWMTACARIPGFFATVPEAEWIDHAGNHTFNAKVIGHGLEGIDIVSFGSGCTFGNHDAPTNSYPYRCCTSR